jgi:hypothetical protein
VARVAEHFRTLPHVQVSRVDHQVRRLPFVALKKRLKSDEQFALIALIGTYLQTRFASLNATGFFKSKTNFMPFYRNQGRVQNWHFKIQVYLNIKNFSKNGLWNRSDSREQVQVVLLLWFGSKNGLEFLSHLLVQTRPSL